MSRVSTLEKAVINLKALREGARKDLLEILSSHSKTICLVLDPKIAAPLNHILVDGPKQLQENGVTEIKELRWGGLETSCPEVLYVVRPNIPNMRIIHRQIKEIGQKGGPKPKFYLYCVPRKTMICEEVLKNAGIMNELQIKDYDLDLIPFDDDILTMELSSTFKECYLDGDKTSLQFVARSIMKLQSLFGLIPNVKVKGSLSKVVWQMVQKMSKEMDSSEDSTASEIDTLIILDRKVDLITPLLTPLTYEGLLDTMLGIENTYVKVDPEVVGEEVPSDQEKKKVTLSLNSNDRLFAEIRDFHLNKVGGFLNQKAKAIQDQYQGFRSNKAQSIKEISNFVQELPELKQLYKSLQTHIHLFEAIKKTTDSRDFRDFATQERSILEGDLSDDRLEERMAMQEPLMRVLKLLCLASVVGGGLPQKQFDSLRREFLQSYGYELLLTLNNLEKVGLLKKRDGTWKIDFAGGFNALKKSLRLLQPNVDVLEPSDVSYVASGYAPITVRLVELAMKSGWSSVGDIMRLLPGSSGEFRQGEKADDDEDSKSGAADEVGGQGAMDQAPKKKLVVFFVGGVTYMEIAALRFLSKQTDALYDIIIATTKIINGDEFLQTLIEEIDNKLLPNGSRA